MQPQQLWARSLALFVALSLSGMTLVGLAPAAEADTSVLPTDLPAANVDSRLATLLGQERSSFASVAPGRLDAITKPPPKPADPNAPKVDYSDAWIDAQPVATGDKNWDCLAKAIYFEARGESVKGEFAVGEVVANRVDAPGFPANICSVVYERGGGACAFSWVCDGLSDAIREQAAWERAGKIAKLILDGAPRSLTDGATYFHATWAHAGWSHRFVETAQIGNHVFFRDTVELASN